MVEMENKNHNRSICPAEITAKIEKEAAILRDGYGVPNEIVDRIIALINEAYLQGRTDRGNEDAKAFEDWYEDGYK